jgi:hypothetical protein
VTWLRRTRAVVALARITIRAWIALAAFDIAQLAGFRAIHDRVRGSIARQHRARSCSVEQIVWAVDEACVWYVKRTACFQRSVVATRLLRRHGHAASLVIAYRPIPFESHAWVEVDGCVVNDLPQYQNAFTVLDRL